MFWLLEYALYLAGSGITLTAGLSSYLAFFQPPFYFPRPTGSHAVGTRIFHLANDPAHPDKELMTQVWYPTDASLAQIPTEPYAPYVINYFKQQQKLMWLLVFSRPMYSYASPTTEDLATSTQKFPVIIFSHGLGSNRTSNTAHCEELASHGYVVISASHSVNCPITDFPVNRTTTNEPVESPEELYKKFINNPMASHAKSAADIAIYSDDIHMTLNHIERMANDTTSPFYNRLDLNNCGIFGHSAGGTTAVQLCKQDVRFKAGANMDGPLSGHDTTTPFDKPFMFLLAQTTPKTESEMITLVSTTGLTPELASQYGKALHQDYTVAINQFILSSHHDAYKITLQNTAHVAFGDMALIKEACLLAHPLQNLGAGKLNGFQTTKITNALLVDFFNTYLKGLPSTLLDEKMSNYPECIFEKRT